MINIEATKNPETEDIEIKITIPRRHIILGHSTAISRRISEMIDMTQFFSMLEDVINLKLGIDG